MARWVFSVLVVVTFAGQMAWSAWMSLPTGATVGVRPQKLPTPVTLVQATEPTRSPLHRKNKTLDIIITSAVWNAGTAPENVKKKNGAPGEI